MNALASALLNWYEKSRRILPWREEPTPYHVLLSEIMLQQTRVDTVVPYFQRFLEAYPTVVDLAMGKEDDVLVLWQGLGYYSRAKNLLKAAKAIVEQGEFPRDLDSLKKLPGVGDYVSRAVLSIAFNEPFVALDGNLMRVYSRYTASPVEPSNAKAKKEADSFFLSHIEEPSHFNQALMDLGELVCLPNGEPKCDVCPFAKSCKAYALHRPLDYPLRKKKTEVRKEELTVLLIENADGNFAIRKRPDTGLLASLYEFPNENGKLDIRELRRKYPFLRDFKELGEAKHRFSHIEWTMHVYQAFGAFPGCLYAAKGDLKKRYSMPTAFLKLLDLLI